MGRPDIRITLQVCNGSGYFQDAGMCPGAEGKPVHGLFKQQGGVFVNLTELFDLTAAHAGICVDLAPPESVALDFPCTDDPLQNLG